MLKFHSLVAEHCWKHFCEICYANLSWPHPCLSVTRVLGLLFAQLLAYISRARREETYARSLTNTASDAEVSEVLQKSHFECVRTVDLGRTC